MWFLLMLPLFIEACTPVLNFTLFGTHDSGAYYLTEHIQPYYDNIPEVLLHLITLAEKYGINASTIITPWAQSQDHNVTQQLTNGMQYIDFRCGWNGSAWNTFHFETGVTCQNILHQIHKQVSTNMDKIYIIEVSHLDGSPLATYNLQLLIHYIDTILGPYLYPKTDHLNLNFTDCDMLNTQRNVILTLGAQTNHPKIWYQPDVIINTYADTPYLDQMVEYNKRTLKYYNLGGWQKFFKFSWTLTPNIEFIMNNLFTGYHSLIQLADSANDRPLKEFNQWRINNGLQWPNIIIMDHYETAKFDLL